MAMMEIVFTREEIERDIPYQMICQTRYGGRWDTMRRKLRWDKEFTKAEREEAEKLFKQSHSWFVGKGVPDTVRMNFATYSLWNKLAEFCSKL